MRHSLSGFWDIPCLEFPGVAPGRRILLRAYSRMRPLPVSGRLHIFPQGGRRTTLQGGFRKEVGRKKVTFGHYSPIQYTIRIYVVSTIYFMYIMLYYTIYCYNIRMGGGKLQLLYLRAVLHILQKGSMRQAHHFVYVFLFAPRPTDGVFSARSSDHPNCKILLLTVS